MSGIGHNRRGIPANPVTVDEVVEAMRQMPFDYHFGFEVRNQMLDQGRPCSYQGVGNALRWGVAHGRIARIRHGRYWRYCLNGSERRG